MHRLANPGPGRRRPMWAALLGVTLSLFAGCAPTGSDPRSDTSSPTAAWPQWGGPRRDFTAEPVTLAASWPEGGPPVRWRRPLGEGYSSVVVDDSRLYTMYRENDAEILVALSGADGRTIWTDRRPAPIDTTIHPTGYGLGPRATPLLADGRVYAAGFNGLLRCVNADSGQPLWEIDLIQWFGGTVNRWGYACSPLACDDSIIMLVGGVGAAIVRLRRDNGTVVWRRHDFANSYASPLLIEWNGRRQLVCFMAREVVGLDPATGDLLWRHPHENQWLNNIVNPVWAGDGRLFITSEGDAGSQMIQLPTGGESEVRSIWHTRKMRISHRNAIRIGDSLFASNGDFGPAPFSALDLATGELSWRERGFSEAACLRVGDKLLLLDEDGKLALVTATPEKLTVHVQTQVLEREAWTPPALVGKTLYLRDRRTIMALELP